MGKQVKIAVAQVKPSLGNLERNLALHEKLAAEAIAQRADLLIFPELSLTGYFLKDLVPSLALDPDSQALDPLKGLSRHIAMVLGFVEEAPGFFFHNAALFLQGGEVRHLHRKVYLPTYGIFDEQRYLAEGDRFRAFDTPFGRMAILICEDMWHPSAAYIVAQQGAEIFVVPSASPGRGGLAPQQDSFANAEAWGLINRAYAQLFTAYILYANRVGYEDGACFWGGSEVIGPSGECLARAEYLEESLIFATLDLAELKRARMVNPMLRDEKLDLTIRELERLQTERSR